MAVRKRPAGAKKWVVKKVVNPAKYIKKIVKPPKKKGGEPIVCHMVAMNYPPATCPKCGFNPVYADAYGSYKCPRCGDTWTTPPPPTKTGD